MSERHTSTRRHFLKTATAATAAGLAWGGAIGRPRAAKNEIVFVGFGGTYQEGQTKAMFEPFEKETGIKIVQTTGVDIAKLRAQAQAAAEQIWDTLADWDPLGRTHEQACPWSYPMAE